MNQSPTTYSMQNRCSMRDYSAPGIYYIMLAVTESLGQPLGRVVGDINQADGQPDGKDASSGSSAGKNNDMTRNMLSKNNTYCHKFLTVLHRSNYTLPILFGSFWSMLRVCLQYAYSMPTPTLRRERCRVRCQSVPYGLLRTFLLLFVLLVMSIGNVWGQVGEGVYYIANHNKASNYQPNNPAANYYLVPADDPHQSQKADAFFNNIYSNNSNATGDYPEGSEGDSGQPFLTTYKTNKDKATRPDGNFVNNWENNSVWVLKSTGDEDGSFYIIHATSGKYIVYAPPYKKAINRKSMHLLTTNTPGSNTKFVISFIADTKYSIRVASLSSGNRFFSVTTGNTDQYYGKDNDYFQSGLVGVYSDASKDGNVQWHFDDATFQAPTISNVNTETNKVTVTGADGLPTGYKIRYTFSTEGEPEDPTATSTEMTNGEYEVTVAGTLKAIVECYGVVLSAVAKKTVEPMRCKTPIISYSTGTGEVTITSVTEGANIYYTLDGTTPSASSTQYGGPFNMADQTTVTAIAIKTGILNSEIASSKLVLNPTIILAETEYTYDSAVKEPEVSVKDGETTIDTDEYTVNYADNTNAGTAIVNIVYKTGGSYIVYGSTTFTIHPAGVTLTANSGIETYDGTEKTVTGFTSSVEGLTFEGLSASGSGTNAGEYDVPFTGVTINTTKDTSGNYVVTGTTNGTLTISPKALTITADSDTKVYDGTALTKDGYSNTELATGDQIESVTVTGSQTIAGTSNNVPGTAVIKNSANDNVTANYGITYINGTLEVTKKTLTITADAKSKAYGEADPTLTYTSEGLINDDAITGTLTREAGEDVGVYAITQGGLTGGNNYAISYAGANLTITKVGLTVTANNNTITYGNAPVGNGVTCEGFVNSETASVLGGTLDYDYSYTQYSDVGNTYTITPKGLTSNNYDISFVAGTLTVAQKEVGITWGETTSFVYDGSAHAPTATATGLVNSDAVTVVVTGAQINVGGYTATVSSLTGDKAGNYILLDANTQSFTISPKSIGEGTLAEGYTLDFGEGNTILLKDDIIGNALMVSADYSVSDDRDASAKYSERTVTGIGNYTGSFDVRNVVVSLTTDTDQEEWSATFAAEKADESDIGHALPEGISAFIISGIQGEWVIPEPLNYIPEGVPVLLVAHKQINGFVATRAESGNVTPTQITDVQKAKNMLEEVTEDTPGYDSDSESVHFETKQIYVLYKNEFVFNKAGNMKKGKIYLNPNHIAPSTGSAPARLKIAWNHTTGIQIIKDESVVKMQDDIWYTIDGRRLSGKPNAKGLYIVDGKKIVIK